MSRAMWRLLEDGSADGASNMALDEAILLAVAEDRAPSTLRFYTWQPPCLSVGYAQPLTRDFDPKACRRRGYDLVRRPTGGRAVLHIDELTYSVTLPQDDPRVAGGVISSYRRLSEGLLAGLRRLGVEAAQAQPSPHKPREGRTAACFDLPSHFEITAAEKKLIGSAQVRRRDVVLQHGALPLWGDITRIVGLLRLSSERLRARLATRLAEKSTTLAQVAGRLIPPDEAARALAIGFAEALDLKLVKGEPTDWERQKAEWLLEEKYGTEEYTFQR
ncbi:MAG: biotin/lipoate A/B protein ligase family protein [Chloroflexota bacterium]|nr:biotin/lipoate A/B protein ligase family protein [Chloroflexota bacterium]